MKTIDFCISENEENKLYLFAKLVGDKDIFTSTEKFMSAASVIDRKKKNKFSPLLSVLERIQSGLKPECKSFYPNHYYSLANGRYESLMTRNFDRIVEEQFFANVFQQFQKSFSEVLCKQDFQDNKPSIVQYLNQNQFSPAMTWIEHDLDPEVQKLFGEMFKDMRVPRLKNLLQKEWKNIFKKELRSLEDSYEAVFEKCLPKAEFIKWFGANSEISRCCEYCDLTESRIQELHKAGLIYTKRFYSRGATIEVDKRDPQKGYELSNLVKSCYWCNNAKTDEFTEAEFKEIAKSISNVWARRASGRIKKSA